MTIDGSGRLVTSPDIITRGYIHIQNNKELMDGIRSEMKRLASSAGPDQRKLRSRLTHGLERYLKTQVHNVPVIEVSVNRAVKQKHR